MEEVLDVVVATESVTEATKEENILMGLDPNYFLTRHRTRLNKLKRDKRSEALIVDYIQELAKIEEDGLVSLYKHRIQPHNYHRAVGSAVNMLGGNKQHQYYVSYYTYQANRLPFCCGVSEYGDFKFFHCKKTNQELLHNLVLDLIRLNANSNREAFSGAISIINYCSLNVYII